MKAKDLIPLLQKHPDAELVLQADDHHYRLLRPYVTKANYHKEWDDLVEYYGDTEGYTSMSVILFD